LEGIADGRRVELGELLQEVGGVWGLSGHRALLACDRTSLEPDTDCAAFLVQDRSLSGGAAMRTAQVEIYSDATNKAVMRHPDRHYPGILIQGDRLLDLCSAVTRVADEAKGVLRQEAWQELEFVREDLQELVDHYIDVVGYPGPRPEPASE